MTAPRALPELVEETIAAVLEAAELGMTAERIEVERELRAHFEDGLDAGATPREMVARFGDPEEAGRRIAMERATAGGAGAGTVRWWIRPSEWKTELVRAARRLGRAPGFAAIVVLTLALGVGVNTAIFTVLDAVLLEDLPYPDPDRLVRLYERVGEQATDFGFLRAPAISEYRTWDEVFAGVAALYTYREVGADLTDGEVPERVSVVRVSSGYFETLGRTPLLGRTFREEESWGTGEAGSSEHPIVRVAVLSHALWQSRFRGDREVVGRTLELDGEAFEIVGVMPASFRDPFGVQGDVWVPQDMRMGGSNNFGNFYLSGVARLRDGIGPEAARERLAVLADAYGQREPEMAGDRPAIRPLRADIVGETRRSMLLLLAAAAGLVLLTACVNVANLIFARGLAQDRAFALRSALGSGRGRLIAGMVAEQAILAMLGGVLGLGLGWLGLRGLLAVAPDALPIVAEVDLGMSVFVFALAVSGLALLVFGLAPAVRLSRTAPADVLRSGDRSVTAGRVLRRVRDGLVVVQVAAALILVAGALLLGQSFGSLLDVPLAVEADDVLTFEVHLPSARYPRPADRVRFHRELHERLAGIPGVESVGAISWLPINGRYHSWGFYWEPSAPDGSDDDAWRSTEVRVIEGDYFEAMGVELLRGDPPSAIDVEAGPVAWVNQWIADNVMAGVDPVGQQIVLAGAVRRVAGVVEDVPYSPRGDVSAKSYVPHAQADDRNWALIQTVKARVDLARLREAVRVELAAIDPALVLHRPRPFAAVLAVVRAQDRFATLLMGAFAVLALTLSLVGTYGVLAGTVQARTREIGIRMALGADVGAVRALVLRYAARLTLPGVVLGLLGAWMGSRWIGALLFGVQAGDPPTYGAAIALFALVGLVAAWLPARRATRVDTVQALTE
jgi:putative ABC transport system permease protein